MSKRCEICGKGPGTGNKVSHSNRKTPRRWLPNLQHVKVRINRGVRYLRVCTRCIRAGRVEKAV